MLILHMLSALWLACILDIVALSILAKKFGVGILEENFGFGPVLHQSGLFKIRLILLGSSVKFKDSREENYADTADAYNHQAVWKQLTINLAPIFITLFLGLLLLEQQGLHTFYISFYQIIACTLAPFSTAQDYLDSFIVFAGQHSLLEVYGLILIKGSAFNLMPLPMLRGWLAIMQLSSMGTPQPKWQDRLNPKMAVVAVTLYLIWCIIFIYWGYRHFFS